MYVDVGAAWTMVATECNVGCGRASSECNGLGEWEWASREEDWTRGRVRDGTPGGLEPE